MIPFRLKSVTLSMLIDPLTSRCRSTQVKLYTGLIASIDLWPQEMFTFSEMLALVQSEAVSVPTSVIGGLRGSTATSDLVSIKAQQGFWEQRAKIDSSENEVCQLCLYWEGKQWKWQTSRVVNTKAIFEGAQWLIMTLVVKLAVATNLSRCPFLPLANSKKMTFFKDF